MLITLPLPVLLDHAPAALRFGTSGLRGLVRDMTDLEAVRTALVDEMGLSVEFEKTGVPVLSAKARS